MNLFRTLIAFLLLAFCCFSCSNESQSSIKEKGKQVADSLAVIAKYSEAILGDWETVSLKIDLEDSDIPDSNSTFYIAKGQFEEKLNLKPFKTSYKGNNTYNINFYDVNDSLSEVRRGLWNIFGDTLLLIENNATYQYNIRFKNQHLELKTLLDWDNDGQMDDSYLQIDKKIE